MEASFGGSARTAAELRLELARLEAAYRYPDALRTLDALLALGDGDRDALMRRRRTLESFVELAEATYAQAGAAKTPEEEAAYLALIQSFWPGYRDVDERLLALRGSRRQGAEGGEPGVSSHDPSAAPGGEH